MHQQPGLLARIFSRNPNILQYDLSKEVVLYAKDTTNSALPARLLDFFQSWLSSILEEKISDSLLSSFRVLKTSILQSTDFKIFFFVYIKL